MVKRIGAVAFIFVCTTIAWMILAAVTQSRTSAYDVRLRQRVSSLWGAPHVQEAPTATLVSSVSRQKETEENGKKIIRTVVDEIKTPEAVEHTKAEVNFHLDYRQKGLLWYSTYKVGFHSDYTFRNTTDKSGTLAFKFPFPAANAVYDDLKLTINGQPQAFDNTNEALTTQIPLQAGEAVQVAVTYRSQGLDSWTYRFSDGIAQVHDFELQMTTDFKNVDFPDNTLSPGNKRETQNGWVMTWQYDKLVSGCQIGLSMPQKLQPGPLVGEISFFAPVSLFFFFFVMLVITTLRQIEMHPVNYFFLACAFFSFHLMMAYLADHISIHAAFLISSIVSIFLVVSYLRLVVGFRFAMVEAGIAQLIYLVLFSYAFFFDGYTGLTITIGSVLTLFILMQITGRIRWQERLPLDAPVKLPRANSARGGPSEQR
ncbi:MAG: inner membrane CreD family protein [Acidobacteriota bacterium]|nr:inner membrane CreD family protein [Acidobacteriota bacterium]